MNTPVFENLLLLVKDRYTPLDIQRYFEIEQKLNTSPIQVSDEDVEFYMTLDTYATSRRLIQST